jgi:catechol 2,3-dioxygenase-like lactoylglutathione lyase family enzyme
MLADEPLMVFVPTRDTERARQFYQQTLGLELISADRFSLMFNAHGTTLSVTNVSSVDNFKPYPFTVLGWKVLNIETTLREMVARGIQFERYAAMEQDGLGIWKSPNGARVAWFKDPDGNVLSITEFPV